MSDEGVIFTNEAAQRISRAVTHHERHYINPGLREEKVVRSRARCTPRNEKWSVTIVGAPSGGTFDMDLNIRGTTETMQFDWNFTAAEVQTELETHSVIASGDVTVSGGPFPNVDIAIEFTGDLARHEIPRPTLGYASLTGGAGVAVLIGRWASGSPRDGSIA